MIRINLLPVRHEIKRQFGRQQLILGLLLIGMEVAILFMIYNAYTSKLQEEKDEAEAIQAEVDELNEQARVLDELNGHKRDLENLADVLEGLESNRTGPVAMMDDLKEMLNVYANDLQRVAQERRGWNTDWDPTSVWLTQLAEDNNAITFTGKARSNDDVAEFTIRLTSSRFFSGVRLHTTQSATATGVGAVFTFQITATVDYEGSEG